MPRKRKTKDEGGVAVAEAPAEQEYVHDERTAAAQFRIMKPDELDPDYRCDGSGHYELAVQPIIDEGAVRFFAGHITKEQRHAELMEIWKWVQTPLGGYRPLPAAKKFHRSRARFRHCLGGNRCLGPDTLIESPDGPPRKVSEIKGPHRVWAWDGTKKIPAEAGEPFVKGREQCFRVQMKSGRWFDCSGEHRILTKSGYFSMREILASFALGEIPSTHTSDVLRLKETSEDSRFDYLRDSCFRGERPLWDANAVLCASPLQSNAPIRTRTLKREGDPGDAISRTPFYLHAFPSTLGEVGRTDFRRDDTECRSSDKPLILSVAGIRFSQPPILASGLHQRSTNATSECPTSTTVSAGGFCSDGRHETLNSSGSPRWKRPASLSFSGPRSNYVESSRRSFSLISPYGEDRIVSWELIGKQEIFDFEVKKYHNYCTGGCVHHNSSKSHSLAVETVWGATGMNPYRRDVAPKPKIIWYCTTTLEKVADILWGKLDPLRSGLLLGIEMLGYKFDVVWRSKQLNIPNILRVFWPNKGGVSEVHFKAYEQGRESFQGSEVHAVAFDEQFPQDVFTEATSRIGPGIPCEFGSAFTPLIPDQWLENRTHWEVPKTDEVFHFPLDDQRIDWGGFIEAQSIQETIDNWPDEVRETRRYGRWGAYVGAIFQSFDPAVHVVSEQKEKELFWQGRNGPGLDMQPVGVIDWGGANPFAFIWATRIPHLDNDWYIFDELFWDYRVRGMCRLEALAMQILQTTRQKWGTHLWRIWADHEPTNANEFRHCGLSSVPAVKVGNTEEIGRAGIEQIQTHLMPRQFLASTAWPKGRPKIHIAARCKELIREFPLYRWAEPTGEKNAKNVPVKTEDHVLDCVRYLLSSERSTARSGKASPRIDAGAYRSFNADRAEVFSY